jgi:hypothetical protein
MNKPKIGDRKVCSNLKNHGSDNGCFECGGYGYTAEYQVFCSSCNAAGWKRPDPITIFDGKVSLTLDGKKQIHFIGTGSLCEKCNLLKSKL